MPEAQPVPAVDAAAEVGESLRALLAASRRLRGRETQRQSGLSYAQYGLLVSLAETAERSSSDLARLADLTPATVTQMLDALEQAGLVARRRADHDRRVVLTALTTRGAEVVAEHRARTEPRWRAALAEFDEQQLRDAARVMERISAFLEEIGEER